MISAILMHPSVATKASRATAAVRCSNCRHTVTDWWQHGAEIIIITSRFVACVLERHILTLLIRFREGYCLSTEMVFGKMDV